MNLAEIVEMIQKGEHVKVTCMVSKKSYLIPILATYLKIAYEDELLSMTESEILEEVKKKTSSAPPKRYKLWVKNSVPKGGRKRSWIKPQKTASS